MQGCRAARLGPAQGAHRIDPRDIIDQLNLRRPIYSQTTNYGHFGKKGMTWEATDKVKALLKAL